jgi:hypothetical protein
MQEGFGTRLELPTEFQVGNGRKYGDNETTDLMQHISGEPEFQGEGGRGRQSQREDSRANRGKGKWKRGKHPLIVRA